MNKEAYSVEYVQKMRRTGKIIGCLGIVFSFLPALILGLVYNTWPVWGALVPAFVSTASVFGLLWVLEPIMYYPILGEIGTYMAFLSGNISNMRVPCATMAQVAAEVEPGTDEGTIVATLGMGVSVVINILVLTLGVILGSNVLAMLPASVVSSLNLILPALFGALFMQHAFAKRKLACIMCVIALAYCFANKGGLLSWLPAASSWGTLLCVFIGIGLSMPKKEK